MKPRLDPRIFLALPLSRTVKAWLGDLQSELKKYLEDWYFVQQDNFHVTLRFFGEIPEDQIPHIDKICRGFSGSLPPLSLMWDRIDFFGPPQAGRVLFAGCRETPELVELVEAVMDSFPEGEQRRRFRPHITLAKARKHMSPEAVRRNSNMLSRLRKHGRIGPEPFKVDFNSFHREFVLMETVWVGRRVEYFPRERYEMKALPKRGVV